MASHRSTSASSTPQPSFSTSNHPNLPCSRSNPASTATQDHGHKPTRHTYDLGNCDHLEESNLPLVSLAKEYLVTSPLYKKLGDLPPTVKVRIVRVVATSDNTKITYDPPQNGAPAALAKAGDYAEFTTDKDFKIAADAKLVVSEYFTGGNGGDSDPAMTIAVPIEHYRTHYSFHAPTNYTSNFVNIIAPTDAKITIDGQPVAGFQPIGVTGYSTARVQLSNAGDGDHTITGDKAFGVQVYGYGSNMSYWYPGGL